MTLMKTIHNHMKLLALVLAVGTIVFVQQNATSNQTSSNQTALGKTIFNGHFHTQITGDGEIKGNDGSVLNCSGDLCPSDKYHSNTNDNVNRPVGKDGVRSHTNTHEMPNGNSDNG